MCSTIDLFLTKRQQLMSAMATLDKDKDSRQEQRRNILLSMVDDALSSLDDVDKDVTTIKKREGFDLMKTLDKAIRLASSVEEESLPSVKKEVDFAAIDDFVQNTQISLNVNDSLFDASRDGLADALFLSTPALHPHHFFLQMPEKNVHFEPVSDKTNFVEMNIFAVKEDVVFNEFVLNNISVELSYSEQSERFSIMHLMKQKQANVSNDGGYVTVTLPRPRDVTGRLSVKVMSANVVGSPIVHNFDSSSHDVSVVNGTLGNLDITSLNESNLADLDIETRKGMLLNASKHYLDRTVYEDEDSTRLDSLSAQSWAAGDLCIARWMEDKVWYNAEVLDVDGTAIQVRFRDYGNVAEVDERFVLPRVEEIPEEDLLANLLDVHLVFKFPCPEDGVEAGSVCIARWSIDNVWYNAVVERVLPKTVWVMFTDYGNSDEVEKAFVLTNTASLPMGAEVDANVEL